MWDCKVVLMLKLYEQGEALKCLMLEFVLKYVVLFSHCNVL
jgi:hypothetical protein